LRTREHVTAGRGVVHPARSGRSVDCGLRQREESNGDASRSPASAGSGTAYLTRAVTGEVSGPIRPEHDASCPARPIRQRPGQRHGAKSLASGTSTTDTHWVIVNWTTDDAGKTVALTPDTGADPPRTGAQVTTAGAQESQWVSTSGTLTGLPNGTGGHLTATLMPDHGIGPGPHFPGTGTVSMRATWTC
jgi:hypothetical protein